MHRSGGFRRLSRGHHSVRSELLDAVRLSAKGSLARASAARYDTPVIARARQTATYHDLCALPANLIGEIGGWVIVDEPELHLGEDIVVPDLTGWRRERMPQMPATASTTLAPDWLCEVLSPSTQKLDRGEKLPLYARERLAHVWLVDPLEQSLEVLRLDGETFRIVATFTADAKVRAEPFDAIELDLAVLWAR